MSIIALAFWIAFWLFAGPMILWFAVIIIAVIVGSIRSIFVSEDSW